MRARDLIAQDMQELEKRIEAATRTIGIVETQIKDHEKAIASKRTLMADKAAKIEEWQAELQEHSDALEILPL